MTEKLDSQWRELCSHATIERDQATLSRLTAETERRKLIRQAEALAERTGK